MEWASGLATYVVKKTGALLLPVLGLGAGIVVDSGRLLLVLTAPRVAPAGR